MLLTGAAALPGSAALPQVTVTWAHVRGVLQKLRFAAWASLALLTTALVLGLVPLVRRHTLHTDPLDRARLVLLGTQAGLAFLWVLVDTFRQALTAFAATGCCRLCPCRCDCSGCAA